MENEERINIDDFLTMFFTVSFLENQKYINVKNFRDYCKLSFNLDDDMTKLIIYKLNQMIDAGILAKVDGFDNLLFISEIPYKEIMYDNFDYAGDIKEFFYGFNDYVPSKEMNLDEEKRMTK